MRSDSNAIMNEIIKSIMDMVEQNKDTTGKAVRISMDLTQLIVRINETETDLKDCTNELCLKCGLYENAHKGACDGCRWLKVKEAFRNG